jgi:hypothetical protein
VHYPLALSQLRGIVPAVRGRDNAQGYLCDECVCLAGEEDPAQLSLMGEGGA